MTPKLDPLLPPKQPAEVNVAALVKDHERYIIIYRQTPLQRAMALREVGRWAGNAALSFSWRDAAQLAQTIRKDSKVNHGG